VVHRELSVRFRDFSRGFPQLMNEQPDPMPLLNWRLSIVLLCSTQFYYHDETIDIYR
jgi:hypothetical protein